MTFKKGQKAWNKGLSSPWTKERNLLNNPAKRPEIREKMSKIKEGKIPKNINQIKQYWKGKKRPQFSEEWKNKISLGRKGIVPWNYIDGRSKILAPARYGDDWDKIRYLIYVRDNFTCQVCGTNHVRLDVHHKIPFLISFDNSLSNLISLCRKCHMKEERKLNKEDK